MYGPAKPRTFIDPAVFSLYNALIGISILFVERVEMLLVLEPLPENKMPGCKYKSVLSGISEIMPRLKLVFESGVTVAPSCAIENVEKFKPPLIPNLV